MILAVTGGRDFTDTDMMDRNLRKWITPRDTRSVIIQGGARGADSIAKAWGAKYGIHVAQVEAQWSTYRRSAGHLRNAAMILLRPEILLAFPGGKGTASAVKTAHYYGVPVRFAE